MNHPPVELANFILKPEGIKNKDDILDTIESNLRIVFMEEIEFSETLIDILYKHTLSEDLLIAMKTYLQGQNALFGLVVQERANDTLLDLTGKYTDGGRCEFGTIRNKYSKTVEVGPLPIIDNAIHRSKNSEQAYTDSCRINANIIKSDCLKYFLDKNNPFSSTNNFIQVDDNGNIVKQYVDESSMVNELCTIQELNRLGAKNIPEILGYDQISKRVIYRYSGIRYNRTGSPNCELDNPDVAGKLGSFLGSVHQLHGNFKPIASYKVPYNYKQIILKMSKLYSVNIDGDMLYYDSNYDNIGFMHGDFSLNNLLIDKNNFCIIDREFGGWGNQSGDIVKFFRAIKDPLIFQHALTEYNKFRKIPYTKSDIYQLFINQIIINLLKQDASWRKIGHTKRMEYRHLLNRSCLENIKNIFEGFGLLHIEF